ncbi:hypothetical protein GCM10010417_54350 [Streptomyces carpaticus]
MKDTDVLNAYAGPEQAAEFAQMVLGRCLDRKLAQQSGSDRVAGCHRLAEKPGPAAAQLLGHPVR